MESIVKWIETYIHIFEYVFFLFFACITLFFLFRNKTQFFNLINLENKEVTQLKDRIHTLESYAKDLENKVRSMELLVNTLIERITEVNNRQLEPLQEEIKTLKIQPKRPARPVLLVYGVNEFGEQDRNALRRAGVSFFRLKYANLDDLRVELHRRRSDGNLYDIVHVSSHGGDEAIILDTDKVDGIELSNVLSGVRGIFLATCSNQNIADKLLGIVRYVVIVYEEIETKMLSDFVFEFYKRYKVDWDIEGAFNGALTVMPEVSEFVDLRIGGTNVV